MRGKGDAIFVIVEQLGEQVGVISYGIGLQEVIWKRKPSWGRF